MYEFTCLGCGKVVQLESMVRERKFCSKKCYGKSLKGKKSAVPDCMRRASHDMCPDGYDNLVNAIAIREAQDVLEYPPGLYPHDDAVWFFKSAWFRCLTDMDGEEILAKLERKEMHIFGRRRAK